MSTTVDNKVVEMRFDNKQFEQGINQSINSLDKLKSTLKFDGVVDNKKLTSISNDIDWLRKRFTGLGEVFTKVKVQAIGLVKELTIGQVISGWSKYNEIISATQTIMSATAKNWTKDKSILKDQSKQMEYVNAQLEKLNWFTDETSASLTDMTGNIGKFTSAGVNLDAATDAMMGIATWGYKSGATIEQMSRAMYNLSQAMGQGALKVQDWMSIENANMATQEFKETAISTAVSLGRLKKDSKGAIYALDKYGKRVYVTTENLRSTLSTGWFDSKVITATLKKYGDFAAKLRNYLDPSQNGIAVSTNDMIDCLDKVKKGVLKLSDKAAMTELAKKFNVDTEEFTAALTKINNSTKKLNLSSNLFKKYTEQVKSGVLDLEDTKKIGKIAKSLKVDAKTFKNAISTIVSTTFQNDLDISTTQLMKYVGKVKQGMLDVKDSVAMSNLAEDLEVDVGQLTIALRELSKGTYDLGYNAFKASQEALSFKQALDYTKDAASTGWMNTFKTIVGDYLESKELWTAVTEELYDVFLEDLDKQNKALREWAKAGGREELLRGLENIWGNIRDVIMGIKEAFKEVFPSTTGKKLADITKRFADMTYVLRFTEDQAERITEVFKTFFKGVKHITDGVKNLGKVFKDALDMNELLPKDFFADGGLFNVIKEIVDEFEHFAYVFQLTENKAKKFLPVFEAIVWFFSSAIESVKNTIKAFGTAFRKVFKNSEIGLLDAIAKAIGAITEALAIDEYRMAQLEKVFEAFFAIIDIGKSLLEAILEPIFGLTDGTSDLVDVLFNVAEFISKIIVDIRDWLKEHDTWKKAIAWVINLIRQIPHYANEASKALFGMELSDLFTHIKDAALNAWEYLKGVFRGIKDDLKALYKPLTDLFNKTDTEGAGGKKKTIFELWEEHLRNFKKFVDWVKPYFDEIIGWFKENVHLELPTFEQTADAAVKGGHLTIIVMFIKYMRDFFSIFKKFGNIEDSVKGVFDTLSKSIKTLTGALKDRIKANTFKTLATGIVEIAAAMFLLALLPSDKLLYSTAAVATMITFMAGAFKVISEVDADNKKLKQVKKLLRVLEELLVLTVAAIIVIVKKTDVGEALIAAGLISALLFEVAGFMAILSKIEFEDGQVKKLNKIIKSVSLLMVAIGAGLALATMNGDWKNIAAAGTVMSGMLFAIAGALRIMPTAENIKSVAAGLALVSASMVLLGMGIALATSSGADWKSIAAAGGIMAGMVLAIAAALKMLDGTDVLKAAGAIAVVAVGIVLLAGALSVLSTLNLNDLGIGLLALAGALAVILISGAVAEKIAPGLLALGAAIALIGVGIGAAGAGIWLFANGLEKLVSLGSAGTETFINGLNAFFENLPKYAENAGDAIITFINKMVGAKATLISGLGTILEVILQALINVSPKILELIKTIISGIFVMLVELLPDLFTFLDELFEQLDAFFWKWAPRIVSTVIMLTRELLRSVTELVPDITATLMTILIDTLTQIRDNIDTINALLIEIAGETIVGILEGLGQEIPRVADAGIDFVVALINGIADGMVEHAQDIHDAMQNLADALIGAFCALLGINSPSTIFEGFGDNIVQGLINGISSMIENAKKIIKDLADGVLTKFCNLMGLDKPNSKEDWSQFGIKIIQRLNAGFLNMVSKAASVITEVGQNVIDAITKFFGLDKIQNSNIYKVGKNVVDGLAKGIKAMASTAVNAIKSVGQGVIDNLKKVFDSHSPSRVAIAIGKFFDQGLAQGLDLFSYLAVNSVEDMGYGVVDALSAVMNSVTDMIDSDFDEPTIKPVLDLTNVADGITTLDNMLSSDKSMTMTSYANREFNDRLDAQNMASTALNDLKNLLSGNIQNGVTNNNVFNITGDNPKEIAEEVSRILAVEVKKEERAWGM